MRTFKQILVNILVKSNPNCRRYIPIYYKKMDNGEYYLGGEFMKEGHIDSIVPIYSVKVKCRSFFKAISAYSKMERNHYHQIELLGDVRGFKTLIYASPVDRIATVKMDNEELFSNE